LKEKTASTNSHFEDVRRSFLGSTHKHRVRVRDLALRVQTSKNVHFSEGARVAVRINHGHFLAAETGTTGKRAS